MLRLWMCGLLLVCGAAAGDDCVAQKLFPPVIAEDLYFGISIAAEADRLAIGAIGTAYICERAGQTWSVSAELVQPLSGEFDGYGYPVSLAGDYAAVSASGERGAVVLFRKDNTTWSVDATLIGQVDDGHFGWSVAMDGDRIVIGAPRENVVKGRVHVYRRVDGEWIEEAVLLPPPTLQWFEGFGWEVAIDGDRIAVGDYSEWTDSSLRVVTFTNDDGEWVQESILDYSHIDEDKYGWWLSLDGDFLLVNGIWAQVNYLYERVEDEWIQRATLDGDPNPFTTGQAIVSRGRYVAEVFGEPEGRLYRRETSAWVQMGEFAAVTGEDVYEGALKLLGAWVISGDYGDSDLAYAGGAVHLIPLPIDCNNNGISDACDIATGSSSDANSDGVPDDCQPNTCPRGGCENLDIAGNDCVIDLGDLGLLLANFNREGWDIAGDSDIDGDVDLADLGAMLAAWGANCTFQSAEEEPR